MAEYGFDLTDFGNTPSRFKKVLKENNLSLKPVKKCKKLGGGLKSCRLEWRGKNAKLITANNPITGVYADRGRQPEKGYASYMGVEGKKSAVNKIAMSVKRYASYIKGENKTQREFI